MKMKKIILSIVAFIMFVPAVVCLSACGKDKEPKASVMDAREIYALSAVSSISYLSENAGGAGGASVMTTDTRPTLFDSTDVSAVKNSLSLFDSVIANDGITYNLTENTTPNTDSTLDVYALKMDIKLVGATGSAICTLYFNETNSETKEEIDDDGVEIEFNTTFSGVVVYGEEKFNVTGNTEVEREDNEVETEIEFKVMKSATEYVIVEQSVENNEIEYEYKLFKDGFVQDLEIEYEQNRNGAEVEFELKNISPNSSTRTTFKIQKANGTNKFNMIFRKNGTNENVSIEKLTETSYKFTYSNAYSETV